MVVDKIDIIDILPYGVNPNEINNKDVLKSLDVILDSLKETALKNGKKPFDVRLTLYDSSYWIVQSEAKEYIDDIVKKI
jgi:hypothetical protein